MKVDASSADARHALEQRLRDRLSASKDVFPLGPSQLMMYFEQAASPASSAYNIPLIIGLHGRMSDARWTVETCLGAVVDRQEMLRARVKLVGGTPMQMVLPNSRVTLGGVRQLDVAPGDDWREAVRPLSREQSQLAFDLATEAPWRASIVRVADDLHVLLVTLHHIVADGWSVGVFLADFVDAFSTIMEGRPVKLPKPAGAYRDYVRQLGENRSAVRASEDFWVEQLKGVRTTLDLPFDRALAIGVGAVHEVGIGQDVTDGLMAVAREKGVTPFVALLTCYDILLARYSGQNEFVVGVSVSNREAAVDRDVIGPYAGVVPLPQSLDPSRPFPELLHLVREQTLPALDHGHILLSRIVGRLAPSRSGARGILFQAGFDYQNTPWPDKAGNHISLVNGDPHNAKLELHLSISYADGGMVAAFEYDTSLLSEATVGAMADAFVDIVRSAASLPGRSASPTLPVDDAAVATQHAGVLDLIVKRCTEYPDADAVQEGDVTTSYAQLVALARCYAAAIDQADPKSDACVALAKPAGANAIAAILGSWWAGRTVVLMGGAEEASCSLETLRLLDVRVLIADEGAATNLLSEGIALIDGSCLPPPAVAPAADAQGAYVVLTSGTSGRPKPVLNGHRELAAYVREAVHMLRISPGDRCSQIASLGFDTSFEEMLPALASGACVVVLQGSSLVSMATLSRTCRQRGVTHLNLPTSLWHELSADASGDVLPSCVKSVVIGGEAANPAAVQRWLEGLASGATLLNTFGPTETTVAVSSANLALASVARGRVHVPIGREHAAAVCYVLDEQMKPVPCGARGELYIGGSTVAWGYLGLPSQTSEVFLPDPFAAKPGARMYRTGDIVRRLPGGELEFIGRGDRQQKIRGHRIDPGHIEAILTGHPSVQWAGVSVRGEGAGAYLLAAVLPKRGTDLSGTDLTSELERWIAERLPEWARPRDVVEVEEVRRTAHGKIDRGWLDAIQPPVQRLLAPPASQDEAVLMGIFSNLLGGRVVGRNDDFFALGGHSLLLIRLLSRIRAVFHVELALAEVLRDRTVAGINACIRTANVAASGAIVPITRSVRRVDGEVFVAPQSSAQQALWVLSQLDPDSSAYNCSDVFELPQGVDLKRLAHAIELVSGRHEAFRTFFGEAGGVPIQQVLPCGRVTMDVLEHAGGTDLSQEAMIAADAERPFDLAQAPLARCALVRQVGGSHLFFFSWHHIITDAWSARLFMHEVLDEYDGNVHADSKHRVDYADYADWEYTQITSGAREESAWKWAERLLDLPRRVDLRTCSSLTDASNGVRLGRWLGADFLTRIRQCASDSSATAFLIVNAALAVLLARVSWTSQFCIGVPMSMRNRQELEQIIGYFINTAPIPVEYDGECSFNELLAQIRAMMLFAQANVETPLHQIMRATSVALGEPVRELFNVTLAYDAGHDSPADDEVRAGARARARGAQEGKFDLSLSIVEGVDGLALEWESRAGAVGAEGLALIAKGFEAWLETLLAHPDVQLRQLDWGVQSVAREVQALELADEGVHAEFERAAAACAEIEAVRCGDVSLSYAQLDARANRVAHLLQSEGVGRGARVGVFLERDEWLPAVLLGIWKSGAAWVALDPAQPSERLRLMVEDSAAGWVVARGASSPSWVSTSWIDLGAAKWASRLSAMPEVTPGVAIKGADLAYVLYTSGSTGRPKGVEIEHRNLLHLDAGLWPELAWLGVGERVQWGWNASYAFDASLQGVLALRHGGTLHVMSQELRLDPAALLAWASKEGVELMDVTPRQAQLLVELGESLPALLVGGEAIDPLLWDALSARGRALNVYGPTEATVDATLARIEPGRPHIGQPLAGVMVQVRDMHGQEVPDGLPGELYVGGGGLGRGYLGKPDLSAERFIEEAGTRWFRTGDRARRDAMGRLVYLGRLDEQVKVRGYRVEPGEVAARLREHPGIAEAHVVPFGEGLWAYVTTTVADAGTSALHALRGLLPDYMVPTGVTVLERMPLNSNGKLDRDRLPAPERTAATPGIPLGEAPGARLVAAVIEDLLDVRGIDADANLFALGAHSLALAKMAMRLSRETGLTLGLAAIFRAPTGRGIYQELAVIAGGETALDALIEGRLAVETREPSLQ